MPEKYHVVLRIIHWLMALAILGLIATGWYMEGLDSKAPNKYDLYPWHKSFGVLVLGLLIIRMIVRCITHVPPLPVVIKRWEKKLSHRIHILLYLGMIIVPVSGIVMSMAGGYGVKVFGYKLPDLIEKNKEIASLAHEVHEIAPYVLLAVILLHIVGALKHRFMDAPEADVLKRMI